MAKEIDFLNDLVYGGRKESRQKIIEANGDDKICDEIETEFHKSRKIKLEASIAQHSMVHKKDYTTDFLFYIFVIASVLIVISLIPTMYFDQLWQFVKNIKSTR